MLFLILYLLSIVYSFIVWRKVMKHTVIVPPALILFLCFLPVYNFIWSTFDYFTDVIKPRDVNKWIKNHIFCIKD